jgi:hypothetical protein
MSSGTVSASSTFQEGKGISFARDIGSRVLKAAQSAKDEKKLQEKIIAKGGEVPESAQRGLFAKALKQEFVSNPINDLKKNFNKKITGAAGIVGLFGSKGRSLEDKMLGKKFSIKKGGFDRSGYKTGDEDDDGGGGAGGGGSPASLGSLVLDIQSIASAVSSMQGLINTQMTISAKMADNLDQIKNVLTEQVSLQQQRIAGEERAAAEASLESSQQVSGNAASTSTLTEGGGILGMLGDIQSLFGILKSLPGMFTNLLKGIVSKIPGGKWILDKIGGKAAGKAAGGLAGEAAEVGAKSLLGKFLRPIFKRIPIIGGLIDFAVSLALGEPVGRAAAKAAGAMLGGALGGLVGSLLPGPGTIVGGLLGGFAGDWVGGSLYDMIAGAFGGSNDKKMAAGGVMIGEAGKEAVVNLNSAGAKQQLGGATGDIDSVGQTYFSAIAGSTLAVTKEFVEGMGPIGSAVAPVIQDDVSKLGKTFDVPATAIKMSVGGASLTPVPGAEKKGEEFLRQLVSGTLEKVADKKDTTKGGGGSGSSGSSGSSGADSPTPTPAPAASPTPTSKPEVTATSFGSDQLKNTNPTFGGKNNSLTNVGNKNLQKVGGGNSGKYYYDGFGNIYSVDKDEKRILTKDEIKNGVPGAAGNLNFFRNLNSGVVNLATHGDAKESGWYDYAANAVKEPVARQYRGGTIQVPSWVSIGDSLKYKEQFTEATPFGKSKISAEGGASVLKKLGDGSKLAHAAPGKCVTGVLDTMAANGVPNPAGTGSDGNNPRGLAAQLIKNYGWGSISGLGKKVNLKSAYGNVGANAMSFSEWKDAVKSNKIPSGAIIFMTRNKDWSGNQSSGHDASIAKQGGKKLWSGLEQAQVDGVGAVYGNASQNIIALTPGGQQIPYDGSTSGDTGEEGESESSDPFEALTSGLLNMISAAGTIFDGIQGVSTDKASYDNSKTNWESIVKTGNQTTAAGATPPKTTVVAAASGGTPGSSAIVAVPVGSTGGTPTALARDTTPGGTPAQLTPVRNI